MAGFSSLSTKYAKLYLQHDATWLYIGVKTTIDAGWDVYLQLRFDGNNDHLLTGQSTFPHKDIQVEFPSPGGWTGYNNYQYIVGSNAYTTGDGEPSGTQRASGSNTSVNYEYKIKISDLTSSTGQTIGFFMLNGTDGTSQHGYEFPINGIRDNPLQWSHIVLFDVVIPELIASYSSNSPNINGQVDPFEWEYANSYNLTFTRNDGIDTKTARLYLQHDDSQNYSGWLYLGIITTIDAGWDVYLQLRIDGYNDHLLAGQSTFPHTDIQVEYPSPGGWNGYNNYQYIVGPNAFPTSEPSGTQRVSGSNTNVNYEFKIKTSDIIAHPPGQKIGFYILNGTDGSSQHGYEFPINGVRDNPSQWSHLFLDLPTNIESTDNLSSNIKIYPNPSRDFLFIKSSDLKMETIELFDYLGNQVMKSNITSKINISNLATGIYLLRIIDNNGLILKSTRVIKIN